MVTSPLSTYPASQAWPTPGNLATQPAALPQAGPSPAIGTLNDYNISNATVQTPQDRAIIGQALQLLGQIQNTPADAAYIYSLGINPVFNNGAEALRIIQSRGIRVEFGDMGDSPAHAQWMADQNLIMINQRYRGDSSPETLYAISEAIYHEAGHAKGGDDQSSIQEELDCLALNTLAHRYHRAIDPAYAQKASTSRLISDGVAKYAQLFFDPDPNKQALINRVVEKYGDLPLSSPDHPVPTNVGAPIALRVAEQVRIKEAMAALPSGFAPGTLPAIPPLPPPPIPPIPPPALLPNYAAFGPTTFTNTGQRLLTSA